VFARKGRTLFRFNSGNPEWKAKKGPTWRGKEVWEGFWGEKGSVACKSRGQKEIKTLQKEKPGKGRRIRKGDVPTV